MQQLHNSSARLKQQDTANTQIPRCLFHLRKHSMCHASHHHKALHIKKKWLIFSEVSWGKKESKISFCRFYNNGKSILSQISSVMVCLTWWSYKLKLSIKLPTSPLVYCQFYSNEMVLPTDFSKHVLYTPSSRTYAILTYY